MDLSSLSPFDLALIGKLRLFSPSLVSTLTLEEFTRLKVSVLNEFHIFQDEVDDKLRE